MPRINILTTEEQKSFDSPPRFNSDHRKNYFRVTKTLNLILDRIHDETSKVCFMLLFGYFKFAKKFFTKNLFYQKDIEHISHKLCLDIRKFDITKYNRMKFLRHKNFILKHLNYRAFNSATRDQVSEHSYRLASIHIIAILLKQNENIFLSELNRG